PLEIEQRSQLRLGPRYDRPVHVQRDAGGVAGRGRVGADAADEDLGLVEVVAEVHARHDRLQVLQVVDLRFIQPVGADGDDRCGNVLQRLLAPLRGHHDGVAFFQLGLGTGGTGGALSGRLRIGGGILTRLRQGRSAHAGEQGAQGRATKSNHDNSQTYCCYQLWLGTAADLQCPSNRLRQRQRRVKRWSERPFDGLSMGAGMPRFGAATTALGGVCPDPPLGPCVPAAWLTSSPRSLSRKPPVPRCVSATGFPWTRRSTSPRWDCSRSADW